MEALLISILLVLALPGSIEQVQMAYQAVRVRIK
jgi:hypothetical protein